MADSRYAKKWGVTKLPAMVYFRRRFPSIYRGKSRDFGTKKRNLHNTEFLIIQGDLLSEDEVLEWLRKNRFRQPELNIFMYALIALAVAFVVYTAFLLQNSKAARKARLKKERDQHQQEGGAASAAAAFGSEADPSEAAAGGAEDSPGAGAGPEGESAQPASAAAPPDASTGKQEDGSPPFCIDLVQLE